MNFNMNFNLNMYGILYKNLTNDKIVAAKDKLKTGDLFIEDILKEQDLVNTFKISSICQLQEVLTTTNLMKLIKYSTSFPEEETYNLGYKFPFYACEILATDNSKVLDKFFEDTKKIKQKYLFEKEEGEEENLKIDKFYANSEEKKLNIKKLGKTENDTQNKEDETKNKSLKEINEMYNHDPQEGEKEKKEDYKESRIIEDGNSESKIEKKNENKEEDFDDRFAEFAKENDIDIENKDSKEVKKEEKTEEESTLANKPEKKDEIFEETVNNEIKNSLANNNSDQKHEEKEKKDEEKQIIKQDLPSSDQKSLEDKKEDLISEEKSIANKNNNDNTKETNENSSSSLANENTTNDSENVDLKDIELSEKEDDKEEKAEKKEDYETALANTDMEPKTEFDLLIETSRYPLLDYLFSFLKTEEELDHVLCGYFSKIFNNLFMSRTVQLVKYLFERPEIILSMVNHFNRISIIECLIKLIKYDTDSIILFDRKSCDEVKEEVFKDIFDFIDHRVFNSDEYPELEVLHSITEFFLECLDDKRTFIFFIKCPKFSLKLFETFLHPTLSKQIYVISRYLEKVYVELTYKPNKQNETKPRGLSFKGEAVSTYLEKEEDNSLECYYFLELFTSMIDYLFSRFKDEAYGLSSIYEKEMENTFGEKQKKLGISKLQILELIFQILKHTFYVHENKFFNYEEDFFIDFYDKIINNEFFSTAVKYFFEFPWNNMYQNIFLEVITEVILFSKHSKTLVEHVLYDIGFLEEIILCVVDEKYSCISKFQFRHLEVQNGFLTLIIEIAYRIKLYSYNNETLLNIIDKSKCLI